MSPRNDRPSAAVGGDGTVTDPLAGPAGTQADRGADVLAAGFGDPGDHPALPPATDHAAVARWMDADAAESRRRSGPPAPIAERPWIEAELADPRDETTAAVRDVPPPAPSPARRHEEREPAGGGRHESGPGDEPPWLRERREEHEFRAEFGEWRTGGSAGSPRGQGLGAVTMVVLAVLVLIVALVALA